MVRKNLPIIIFILLVFVMVALSLSIFANSKYSVNKTWATTHKLSVPESVYYDIPTKTIYVSNITGNPAAKDGNGFISKLSPEGKILELRWAIGLNAPKGISIYHKKLYVSDIDHLVCIELPGGKIVKRIPVPGAVFLNDVATDERGSVYVSDSSGKNSAIYRLKNGIIHVWLKGDSIKNPNGLFYENGKLYIGNSGDGKLKSVDINTGKITTVANVGSAIDGLILDHSGFFLVSDWRGRISIIGKNRQVKTLLDTTEAKINAADLGYIPEKKIILVPTFYDNRVIAYKLNIE